MAKSKGLRTSNSRRFWYEYRGWFTDKEASTNDEIVVKGEKKVDELTGLPWEKVVATVWMKKEAMLNDVTPIWKKLAKRTKPIALSAIPNRIHFDANTMFNGMLAFVNFDTDSEALVLKYLSKALFRFF